MRALFWIAATLVALYGGYWFVGQNQVETRAAQALDALEARGWEVDYASLNTTGFPSRFDTTVTGLRLASPDGQLVWEAPFFQVFALSYRPNEVIAVWPPEERLTVAGRPVDIAADRLRASAAVGLSAALPLRDAVVESGPLAATGEGWEARIARLLAAIRREPGGPEGAYDLWLEATDLAATGLPATLPLLRLDARMLLGAPLDRMLAGPPPLLALDIREARVQPGAASLTASGSLAPDAEGVLEGELLLVLDDWRAMLDLAEQAGLLGEASRLPFENALAAVADAEGRIELPLTFADGWVSALGLPLIEAPRLPAPPSALPPPRA